MDLATFVSRVREVGQFNDSDEDITDAYIYQEAYQGLLERFTQPVIMLRNGSWLQHYSFSTTAGVSQYRIPQRSIAQGLEKVEIDLGSSGAAGRLLLNVLTNIQATDYEALNFRNSPGAFTYLGDTLTLYPVPSAAFTIHVYYYLRPSVLSGTAATKIISAVVDNGNGTYTLTATAHGLGVSGFLDIQHTTGNCEMIVPSLAFTGDANHVTVALTADQANQLIVNETAINQEDTTRYIQLPQELQNALVSYTAAVALAEKGDSEKAQIFSQKCETAIKNIVDISMPRSKGQPPVFKTRNTYLRRRVGRWGFGGWGGV